ncbi:hypothetical protein ACU8KH_04025 [Lachancea thermotolerans]
MYFILILSFLAIPNSRMMRSFFGISARSRIPNIPAVGAVKSLTCAGMLVKRILISYSSGTKLGTEWRTLSRNLFVPRNRALHMLLRFIFEVRDTQTNLKDEIFLYCTKSVLVLSLIIRASSNYSKLLNFVVRCESTYR